MSEIADLTYYQKNRTVIINKAKDYYKNNKERLKEQTRDKYSKLKIKFHSLPVSDKIYLITKVKEYDGMIKTNFLGNGMPKENMHYTSIACITIDFVMRMDKKNYPQVYLEERKYKIKRI